MRTRLNTALAAVLGPILALQSPTLAAPKELAPEDADALMLVSDAIAQTESDEDAIVIVIALPDDQEAAASTIARWGDAATGLDRDIPVYFMTGESRDYLLANSAVSETPAVLAYRAGMPVHTRAGCMSTKTLRSFLAIALDETAPLTHSAEQAQYLFDDMKQTMEGGNTRAAAQNGCMLLLNIHALTEGPYASSYARCERMDLDLVYNLSLIQVAEASRRDPAAAKMFRTAAHTAKRTWDKGAYGHLGLALWIDIAPFAGLEGEVLAWAKDYDADPRVAEGIRREGTGLRSLFIDNERWGELAMTINSVDDIELTMDSASKFAQDLVDEGIKPESFYGSYMAEAAYDAGLMHAALIFAGRDTEAWQVESIIARFGDEQVTALTLCAAANQVGVLTSRHAALRDLIDESRNPDLARSLSVIAGASDPALVDD